MPLYFVGRIQTRVWPPTDINQTRILLKAHSTPFKCKISGYNKISGHQYSIKVRYEVHLPVLIYLTNILYSLYLVQLPVLFRVLPRSSLKIHYHLSLGLSNSRHLFLFPKTFVLGCLLHITFPNILKLKLRPPSGAF